MFTMVLCGLQLENGLVVEAVHALIGRMALTRMHFGEGSERAIRAELTVARAYLELRRLPRQALKHAESARATLKHGNRHAINPSGYALLEASVLWTLGAAQIAVARLPESKGKKGRKSRSSATTSSPAGKTVGGAKTSRGSGANSSTGRRSTTTGGGGGGGAADGPTPADKLLAKARKHLTAAGKACAEHAKHPAAPELTIQVHVSTAALHRCLREHNPAATHLRLALAALEKHPSPPPDQEQLGSDLRRELAEVEASLGDHGAAVDLLGEALGQAEAAHGPHSPELAEHLLRIARARMAADDDAAAEAPLSRAVRLLEGGLGADPAVLKDQLICGVNDDVPYLREWLDAVDEATKLQIRLGEYRPALESLKLVAPIRAELFGPKSAEAAQTEYLHGNVLLALEKVEPAVKRIARAREMWVAAYSTKHRKVAEADALLASIKADEAARGRKKKTGPARAFK